MTIKGMRIHMWWALVLLSIIVAFLFYISLLSPEEESPMVKSLVSPHIDSDVHLIYSNLPSNSGNLQRRWSISSCCRVHDGLAVWLSKNYEQLLFQQTWSRTTKCRRSTWIWGTHTTPQFFSFRTFSNVGNFRLIHQSSRVIRHVTRHPDGFASTDGRLSGQYFSVFTIENP